MALAKGLRDTTITSYLRFFNQMGISDLVDPSLEAITDALWTLDNPNTRRSANIAVRSVVGHQITISASHEHVISKPVVAFVAQ